MSANRRRIEFAAAIAFVAIFGIIATTSFNDEIGAYEESSRQWGRRAVAYARMTAFDTPSLAIALAAARREVGTHPISADLETAFLALRDGRMADVRTSLAAAEATARSLQSATARETDAIVARHRTLTAAIIFALALIGAAAVTSYLTRCFACTNHELHAGAKTLEVAIWEPRPTRVEYVHAIES